MSGGDLIQIGIQSCKTCRFKYKNRGGHHECRRLPPVPILVPSPHPPGYGVNAFFPPVDINTVGCGYGLPELTIPGLEHLTSRLTPKDAPLADPEAECVHEFNIMTHKCFHCGRTMEEISGE